MLKIMLAYCINAYPSNLTFLLIAIDENGFRRLKKKGRSTKGCLRFYNVCLGT